MPSFAINVYATAQATVVLSAGSIEEACDRVEEMLKPARLLDQKSGLSIGFDDWAAEGAPVEVQA